MNRKERRALRAAGAARVVFFYALNADGTAALKPLQRRRLVTVMVDTNDRRSRRLKLTRAGRALLARAVPVWQRTHAEIDQLVPGAGADRLRRDLRALT
jgi:DNA-binding MarR family transcriptional regulator